MIVRFAKSADIGDVVELGSLVNEFQVSDEVITFWRKETLYDCVENKNSPILVAEENNKIVGFIIANYNPSFKKAIIENIFVDPNYRGKKVGRLLLNKLLNELEKLGCEYVCTLVESKNGLAINFYSHNSFNKGINCIWFDKILGKSFRKSV